MKGTPDSLEYDFETAILPKPAENHGGEEGTRTRGLCRDGAEFTRNQLKTRGPDGVSSVS
jgi:hypothetical protein